jgi:hypothetical protein
MASINRVHGQSSAGAFFGYTPIVVKIAATGKFTADSVSGTTGAITDGGYTIARRVIQTFGSIVWLSAQNDDAITVIVDQPTLNQVAGSTTTGNLGALKDALATALAGGIGAVASYTVTVSSTLNGAGTFTFASP